MFILTHLHCLSLLILGLLFVTLWIIMYQNLRLGYEEAC